MPSCQRILIVIAFFVVGSFTALTKVDAQDRLLQTQSVSTRPVEQVLESISSGRFQQREKATAELYEIAKADSAAVKQHASHVEPEVRGRVQMVLDLVDLGLPLGTSRDELRWTRQFVDGNEQTKTEVLIDALASVSQGVSQYAS